MDYHDHVTGVAGEIQYSREILLSTDHATVVNSIPNYPKTGTKLASCHPQSDVFHLFSLCHPRKSPGPDKICGNILTHCAEQLAPVFTDIFNSSLNLCKVPILWKMSTIVPVPKRTHRVQWLPTNSADITGHKVPGASGKEVHCISNPPSYGPHAICLSSLQGGGWCNLNINAPFADSPWETKRLMLRFYLWTFHLLLQIPWHCTGQQA